MAFIEKREKVWTFRNPATGEIFNQVHDEYGFDFVWEVELTEKQKVDIVDYLRSSFERYKDITCFSDIDTNNDDIIWYDEDGLIGCNGERDKALFVGEWIIYEEEVDADFFAVQVNVDGFGHDTATYAIYQTYNEARMYADEWGGEVVPQQWGRYNEQWG